MAKLTPIPMRLITRGRFTATARLMATAEGYCMVRRPGCMPFVVAEKEWDAATEAALQPSQAKGAE